MAKWQEREHILNRFPSSVHDVFMWRAGPDRGPGMLRVYTPPLEKNSPFFFGGVKSFEFKRFKTISQGVARRIVGPRTVDRPFEDDSFSVTRSAGLSPTAVLDPFSFLLVPFSLSDCDLLRTFKRAAAPPCPKEELGASLSTRKISVDMTNGRRRTTRSQCASSRLDTCC